MKITSIKSHVLRYELEKEIGYSQQYYKYRTAHLVEIETDEGITGWGECFGPGNIALANKFIVEKVRNYRDEWKINNKITDGRYTKPILRKKLFIEIKAAKTHGTQAGQWSARKAQYLAKKYKAMGGDYF